MIVSEFNKRGFEQIPKLYSEEEVSQLIQLTEQFSLGEAFGLRAFLVKYPKFKKILFSENLFSFLDQYFPHHKTIIKSIYFDKPPNANWIVNWHQDITINLSKKREIEGFSKWRETGDRVVAQAPISLLNEVITLRIHLDHCDHENGALQVAEKSHKEGIIRHNTWNIENYTKHLCAAKKGDVLLMSPLIMHASKRTENQRKRRIIHIELIHDKWVKALDWKERIDLKN